MEEWTVTVVFTKIPVQLLSDDENRSANPHLQRRVNCDLMAHRILSRRKSDLSAALDYYIAEPHS
jgi:hypothetical protein